MTNLPVHRACTALHTALAALATAKTSRVGSGLDAIKYSFSPVEIQAKVDGHMEYTSGWYEVVVALRYYYVQFHRTSDEADVVLDVCDETDDPEKVQAMTMRVLEEARAMDSIASSASCVFTCPNYANGGKDLVVTATKIC